MLKKTITYTDFNGDQQTEDFYFNLTTAELTMLEMSYPQGLANHLRAIVASDDRQKIITTFRDLIRKTVGIRSEDGKRFLKSDEIADAFEQSGAYSEFFMDLVSNEGSATEFLRMVLPKDVQDKIASIEAVREASKDQPELPIESALQPPKGIGEYTREELLAMSAEELKKLMDRNKGNVPKQVLQAAFLKGIEQ